MISGQIERLPQYEAKVFISLQLPGLYLI